MGKKSRRPNRINQKDAAAAALEEKLLKRRNALKELVESKDWEVVKKLVASKDLEGILQLESAVTNVANKVENMDPLLAGDIYLQLASAHSSLGREGGVDRAIVCFHKSIEIAKKAGDEVSRAWRVIDIFHCYVEAGRIDEAMDLHKSLVADIGKERLNPNYILRFAGCLKKHKEFRRALEVLEDHLDVVESTWDKSNQAAAYGTIAYNYFGMYDYNKSNVYYERKLSIAKEIKDMPLESDALLGLGCNHGFLGNYEKGMEYLEQGLVALSELGNIYGQGRVCSNMGHVLLSQDGREKEAIEMLQKSYGILETCDYPEGLSWILCKIGEAFRRIEAWDDAITALKKSISISASIELEVDRNEHQSQTNQVLGQTYLEQYYSDESLVSVPESREEVIRKASLCSQEAIKLGREDDPNKPGIYLDLAQANYFLGDTEKAQAMLKEYLDQTVKLGPSHCQMCHQACPKDAHMTKCSVCKVARYCSRAHSIQSWQRLGLGLEGRLCHKVMCPLLKRWRKLQGRKATTDSCSAICNDFFEIITVVSPLATPHPYPSEIEL